MMQILAISQEEKAAEKAPGKISGQVILMSATNSNLTGHFFNDMPAVRGTVTASKGGFGFLAGRNSDLINPKSPGNVCILMPSYSNTFGKYTTTFTAELYLFDHHVNMDVFAPGMTFTRRGAVNVELFVAYGWSFQHERNPDMFTQRVALSKEIAGFNFRLIGWNLWYGTHRNAAAFEISKNLTEQIRLFISGNRNHNYGNENQSPKTHKFGTVRFAYSF